MPKLYPPFEKESGVPESAWVSLMLKAPTVFETVYSFYIMYMGMLDWEVYSRSARTRAQKRFLRGKASTALLAPHPAGVPLFREYVEKP